MISAHVTSSKHVAVVGGGITGLATAFALHEQAAQAGVPVTLTLINAEPAWGGKIVTHRVGDLIIEGGPDSFLSQKPAAIELCAKLGLSEQLINTNELHKKTFVFSGGRLRELPEGLVLVVPTKLGPFLRSGLVSWPGLVRMAMDLVIPPRRSEADESLASFFRRRIGREAFERVVEPLMAGIYAGDAEQMSLSATFPRFRELERQHGSLIRGMLAVRHDSTRRDRSVGPPRTMFVTLRDGLGTMVDALVSRLSMGGVRLMPGRRVLELQARYGQSAKAANALRLEDGTTVSADALVLATPAYVTAELVRPLNGSAAELLKAIPYASTATISLAYDSGQVDSAVRGFGFVVPRAEGRDLLAATWSSIKWPNRAPATQTLIRCYVGGMGRDALIKLADEPLVRRVQEELASMTGLAAEPFYVEVSRWVHAMPQYTLGHLRRLDEIQKLLDPYPGLYLAGAAYHGIGIPDCIRDGTETAAKVLREVAGGSRRNA